MYSTNFFEEKILNTMRGITAPGVSKLFAGLFFNSPEDSGMSGIEVVYPEYSRQPVEFSLPADENGGRGVRNTNDILFPMTDTNIGTAHYIGIFDAAVGGNMLIYGQLTVPLSIDARNRPNIRPGDMVFWIGGAMEGTMSMHFMDRVFNNLRGATIEGFKPRYALYSGHPEKGGTELAGLNYARPEINFSAPVQQDGGCARMVNADAVAFAPPGEDWGMWTHDAIVGPVMGSDVPASGGQVAPVFVASNEAAQNVLANYSIMIDEGSLVVDFN